jgi:hypothetical protein
MMESFAKDVRWRWAILSFVLLCMAVTVTLFQGLRPQG